MDVAKWPKAADSSSALRRGYAGSNPVIHTQPMTLHRQYEGMILPLRREYERKTYYEKEGDQIPEEDEELEEGGQSE